MQSLYNIVLISNKIFRSGFNGKNGMSKVGEVVSVHELHTSETLHERIVELSKEHDIPQKDIEAVIQ